MQIHDRNVPYVLHVFHFCKNLEILIYDENKLSLSCCLKSVSVYEINFKQLLLTDYFLLENQVTDSSYSWKYLDSTYEIHILW